MKQKERFPPTSAVSYLSISLPSPISLSLTLTYEMEEHLAKFLGTRINSVTFTIPNQTTFPG